MRSLAVAAVLVLLALLAHVPPPDPVQRLRRLGAL